MNITISAHNSKKNLMVDLCIAYRHILSKHNIYSTGSSGRLIEAAAGLTVTKCLPCHLGGEKQLVTQIAHNSIDLMIFLADATTKQQFDASCKDIFMACCIHNIPLALNLATAEILLCELDGENDSPPLFTETNIQQDTKE